MGKVKRDTKLRDRERAAREFVFPTTCMAGKRGGGEGGRNADSALKSMV